MSAHERKMTYLNGYYVGRDPYKILGRGELRETERQLGCNLPSDYAHFLGVYGGFAFDSDVIFPLKNYPEGNTGLLDVFFGVLPGDSYDLVYRHNMYRSRIGSGLLPIAVDPGGNIVCLRTIGADVGAVYFWDHEEELTQESGDPIVYFVADSFDQFLDSLQRRNEE